MLILFDVDGTLLLTRNAGRSAMEAAGRDVFHAGFRCEMDFAGKLDPLIFAELCALNGIVGGAARHDEFRQVFGRHLAARLADGARARPLPGVPALLDTLEEQDGVVLGVLSGNYPETGRMKIDAAGLRSERFAVSAWGTDGAQRPDLVPVALAACAEHVGVRPEPEEVVIVGDTPADVATARAHGCRSLAVASGPSTPRAVLEDSGADIVLDSLEDKGRILDWLLSR